jgi:hypothetical protein
MKKFICLFVLLGCFLLQASGQNEALQRKIQSYTRMRTMGYSMLGVGAGFATAGTVLLIALPDGYWDDDEDYDEDDDFDDFFEDAAQLTTGVIFLGVGIGLVAGGVTMSSIANHKIKLYKGKLSDLSMDIMVTPNTQGLKLVYRF